MSNLDLLVLKLERIVQLQENILKHLPPRMVTINKLRSDMVKNGESPISKDILYKLCNNGIIGVKIGNVIRINANTIWYDLERAGLREFKQKGRTKIMLIE